MTVAAASRAVLEEMIGDSLGREAGGLRKVREIANKDGPVLVVVWDATV